LELPNRQWKSLADLPVESEKHQMISFANDVYLIGTNHICHMDFSGEGSFEKNWTCNKDSLPKVEKVFAVVKLPDCPVMHAVIPRQYGPAKPIAKVGDGKQIMSCDGYYVTVGLIIMVVLAIISIISYFLWSKYGLKLKKKISQRRSSNGGTPAPEHIPFNRDYVSCTQCNKRMDSSKSTPGEADENYCEDCKMLMGARNTLKPTGRKLTEPEE